VPRVASADPGDRTRRGFGLALFTSRSCGSCGAFLLSFSLAFSRLLLSAAPLDLPNEPRLRNFADISSQRWPDPNLMQPAPQFHSLRLNALPPIPQLPVAKWPVVTLIGDQDDTRLTRPPDLPPHVLALLPNL
jgi:hypothetical protein